MTNPKPKTRELDKIQEELINIIEEYFLKIKPQGVNKGRGEAAVIVGIAMARFKQLLTKQKTELERQSMMKVVAEIATCEQQKTVLKADLVEKVRSRWNKTKKQNLFSYRELPYFKKGYDTAMKQLINYDFNEETSG